MWYTKLNMISVVHPPLQAIVVKYLHSLCCSVLRFNILCATVPVELFSGCVWVLSVVGQLVCHSKFTEVENVFCTVLFKQYSYLLTKLLYNCSHIPPERRESGDIQPIH